MLMRVKAYDVFDTAVTRCFARPRDIFAETALRSAILRGAGFGPDEWSETRERAETIARRGKRSGEITVAEISSVLAKEVRLSADQLRAVLDLEWQIELESILPVQPMKREIAAVRAAGTPVAFLSDTYMSADQIRCLLIRCGIWKEGDIVLVSSEEDASKHSGALFRKANRAYEIISHTGDNCHADVGMARLHGIEARHFTGAHLNRYELSIADDPCFPKRVRSLIAGAARAARLSREEAEGEQAEVLWSTGADLIGPVFFGFVEWILRNAVERGLETIYFVSRDGQLLLAIAHQIIDSWQLPISANYLYGSRQAWHLPATTCVDEHVISWAVDMTRFSSIDDIAQRLDLESSIIQEALARHGVAEISPESNLVPAQRETLRRILRSDMAIQDEIVLRASHARKFALAYLRQEGLLDKKKCALVDVGWQGRLAHSLSRLLAIGGRPLSDQPGWYYFALTRRGRAGDANDPVKKKAYFYHGDSPRGRTAIMKCREIYEIFLQATHGSVMGYCEKEGRFEPVLADEKNTPAVQWGLKSQQGGSLAFARKCCETLAWDEAVTGDWTALAEKLLKALICHPTVAEARHFGGFRFADGQVETSRVALARAWTVREALIAFLSAEAESRHIWSQGSEVLSSRTARLLLRLRRRWERSSLHRLIALPMKALRGLHRRFKMLIQRIWFRNARNGNQK